MAGLGLSIPDLAARARAGPAGVFDFSGGVLPGGAVLSRASAGRWYDAAGVLTTAANDAARFDRDPVGHGLRGLLIEPAGGNLAAWSEAFDMAAGWTVSAAATVAANAGVAPDGATSADRLTPGTSAGAQTVIAAATAFTAGADYSFAVFAKAAGFRYCGLRLPAPAYPSGNRFATFDLIAGTVAAASAGVATAIEPVGGGWYRCQLSRTAEASASAGVIAAVQQSGVATSEAFAGDGTAGLLLWGAQIEGAAAVSSYIPTVGSGAARAADAVTLNWGARGVADGMITVRHTFDDGSSQDAAAIVAGGVASVPAGLNRRWLRRAEKL